MSGNALVFHDVETPIEILLEQAIKNPVRLEARDVHVVDAARAADGEVWSPQLPPYRAWRAAADDGARAAGADDAAADAQDLWRKGVAFSVPKQDGHDGDLLLVGSLGMGISDEERERLLARAAQEGAAAEDSGRGLGQKPGQEPGRGHMEVDLRGAVEVRQDVDGYALVGVDLRRFAAAVGSDEDLVVVLPAFVDGVPVVRVAAEAFARRLVQGVGVRLLVVPDTVVRIASGAFLALSAGCIHLGCSVETLGEQPCDLAGVSPRLRRREFSVDARNARYAARGGSLFADDGARLLFLASPYDVRAELPAGVRQVGPAAFAAGCEPPSVVACPSTLARVDSKAWDDAVWLCPEAAPAHGALALRGVRLAGPRAVEQDGCWYDFDGEEAVLVAGPPPRASVSRRFAAAAAVRAAALRGQNAEAEAPSPGEVAASAANSLVTPVDAGDILALPRRVEGRPLARIGVRALPHAPASLVVPDTVRVIERDNACRGVKRLVLPEGLRTIGAHCFCSRILEGPVPVPASVRSVSEGSFEYAVCRLEHVGAVVHVSADQLLSCFLADPTDGVPFDFGRYDELLRAGKNLPDRLGAVLHRLAVPCRLDGDTRAALVARLHDQEREAQERIAREGDCAMVKALVEAGFIDERTFDRQIELLRACNRTDCVAYLMQWHREQGGSGVDGATGAAPTLRDRFAL